MTDSPKFPEMAHVRVADGEHGYVIAHLWKDGRWLYKLSLPDPDAPQQSFDNWYPEEKLERVK